MIKLAQHLCSVVSSLFASVCCLYLGKKSRTLCLYSQEAYKASPSLMTTRKTTCNRLHFQESEVAKEQASAGSVSDCSGGIPVEFQRCAGSTTR